jgi:drug/metabolite transporter (DMT)-like permease
MGYIGSVEESCQLFEKLATSVQLTSKCILESYRESSRARIENSRYGGESGAMLMSAAIRARSNLITVIAAFAAVYVIWGTTYTAIRVAVETMPPFLMAGVRFVIAGVFLYAFLRARGVPRPTRIHWRSAAIIGAFLLLGGNGLVTWSEQQVPSSVAALVVATMPLWMTLFDWLMFQGARPTRRVALGLLLGLVGIVLLLGPEQIQGTATFSLFSLVVLLMAPILWSVGSLYSRKAATPENVFMTTAMEMLAGGAMLLVAGVVTGEVSQFQPAEFSARSLAALVYLILFGSIVAFSAYIWLLKHEQPARVSTYTYVNPVIATLLGWMLLDERLTPLTLAAVAVIVAAVALITTQRQKAMEEEPVQVVELVKRQAEPVGD